MAAPPSRTGRQFILLFSGFSALILATAILIVYYLALNASGSVYLGVLLVLVLLAASVAIGGLVAFMLVRLLRQFVSDVRTRALGLSPSAWDVLRPSAIVNEFGRLLDQIAADQASLRQQNRELRLLATISHALDRASSMEEMLDTVLIRTSSLLGYRRAYIALVDEDSGAFEVLASQGYTDAELEALSPDFERGDLPAQAIRLPLRTGAGTIGAIYLELRSLEHGARHLVHLLGEILQTAIEKRGLFEEAQRKVRAQTLLYEAGRVLTSTLDKQEVLTRIMHEVTQALNAEAGSVVLVDPDQRDMYFAAAASPSSERFLGTRMDLGQGIVGWTIEHQESVLVGDAAQDPRFYERIDQQTGLTTRSLICVPLLIKGEVIGAIEVVDSIPYKFAKHDSSLLESLAPQAAIAIDNASLHENLKTQMAELERTQDQLLQAEKLSAVGRLVAGVAHELNNPLTAIIGYAQWLLETCQDEEICEDLERIDREAQRSARIVQKLMSFSRQSSMEKLPVDLIDALDRTIELLAYQLEVDNIELIRDVPPGPMVVLGDRYQLQQVFLNLVSNAHHAMRQTHGSGTLTIRAHRTETGSARVTFSDDGPGMSKEIKSRIFDPFFTTKDVGEGTGLGLSICLGIVQEHRGQIWVESEEGQGATFAIELPLHSSDRELERLAPSADLAPFNGKGAILVVDDEVEISRLLKRVLEVEGHDVTATDNGYEAKGMVDRQPFDLIICDLKMPGIDGRELYAYLHQTRPELARRVVFSTGDVISDESRAFLRKVGNRYITKPFKREQILHVVGQALAD
jgi:signal transduction histidine kinase